MDKNDPEISLSPLNIVVIYLIVAGIWIAFTDRMLESWVTDPHALSILQTYKGWFYVLLTGAGLYWLIKKHDQQLQKKEVRLENLLGEVQSEKELKDVLFERIPILITIYDPDLEQFEVNREFEKVIGWTNEEIKEKNIDLLKEVYPDLGTRKNAVQFMNNPGLGWKEFTITTKNGHQIPTSWTQIRLTDNTSVGIGIDMTDIKASQAKIRESRELLKKIFESLESSLIVVDPQDRTIVDCNSATEKIFGYSQDKLLGSSTKMLHVDEESYQKFDEMSAQPLANKGVFQTEFQMQKKDGTVFYSDHTVTLVYDEDGEVNKVVSVVRDITERKKSEKELQKRKEFIEKTIQNLPIGVAVNNIDNGKVTLINKKFTEIYGWPQKTLKDFESFFKKVYPEEEYRQQVFDMVNADIASGNPDRMQWKGMRVTTQEGKERIVNAKNIPLYDQNLMISTVVDVTEQKELEQELKKEKQRFQLVAETTSDIIWDLDFKTEELWWSEGFEEVLGYERHSLKENYQKWSAYIHPDDKDKITESSEQALNSASRKWKEEYRLIKADGSIAHMVDRAIIIRDNNGKAIRMVGTMDDITERRKAQKKLRESEEKYRHLFENNPEPMWIYNPETLEFIEVNKSAINHYGYTEEEFLKMTLLDIRPEEDADALRKNVEQNKGEKSYSEEWVHLKKDGSPITVELSAADVQYGNQTYRLVLVNDITQQKQMQEKIIQSLIEGEDRERKRIAHELHDGLGQYLVAASMNLQSAKADIEELSNKRQNQFKTGLSLLKSALSETRSIAHNLMPKAIADYGLTAALENLVNNFKKSTDIEFSLTHNCDQLKLNNQTEINIYRIFQEIITNAIRHAECTKIDIRLQLKDDSLTLIIKDNGIGAKLDEQDEETGLGLRSIKTRVRSLKGSLDIHSEPGKGMKTCITIPEIDNLKSNKTDHG
ncbi:PAS domain S-box protein [Fodinibius sp. SL11]|uniref:PAS domain-containing sensor histidine kinase n=1 Tax=Fodinibius sp. SL11 TaxID=3425690 RepID=UPI003F881451